MAINKPQVSVIVPAYNAGSMIGDTITSVLAQSFSNFELIICNDASTDDTVEVVHSFKDDRIRLIQNPINSGEGKTRDHAISVAKGQWLAVLDADDAWMPERLERLLGAVGNQRDCMIFDDIMTCHDTLQGLVPWRSLRGTNAFGAKGTAPREVKFEDFLRSDRLLIKPLISSQIVRESGVQHSQRRFGADSEFFIRLVHFGLKLIYLPEPMYLYRVTPGSATAVAGGAHLMRDCIEECERFNWNEPSIREAFRWKISALRDNELLYKIAENIKDHDVFEAILVIFRNPRILRILPRRLSRHLTYQIHRWVHSGRRGR